MLSRKFYLPLVTFLALSLASQSWGKNTDDLLLEITRASNISGEDQTQLSCKKNKCQLFFAGFKS